jgi:hypothetical protein
MRLTDEEWRAIKSLKLKLSDEARSEIDRLIDLEVRVRRSRQKPAEIRGTLKRLHAIASKLSHELAGINGGTLAALIDTGPPELSKKPKHDAFMLLRERQMQIATMMEWLQIAAENVTAGKRGPDNDGREWLARQCAGFFQHHNVGHLSRSYKAKDEVEFTRIVLEAGARATGRKPVRSGTGAIRRAVKPRRKISPTKRG